MKCIESIKPAERKKFTNLSEGKMCGLTQAEDEQFLKGTESELIRLKILLPSVT
jgi:hypothetical protein